VGVTAEQLVEQTIRVQDQATGPLAKMASAAGGLYDGILKIVGVGAALGGALSLHGAWESTEKYVKNLKEVRDLTGATATETDFLFSSARKAGVEYEQMKGVMFQLSRRGAMLEQTMAVSSGRTVPGLAKKFQRLGVDMTKGPVTAIENMAAAVKQGKVDTGELMSQFRIPQGAVNDFKEFLDKLDPAQLKKIRAGGVKGLIQEKDVDAFAAMEEAGHRVHDAWNRIKVLFLSRFLPILAETGRKFADSFEAAIPKVLSFADTLSSHMDEIVLAAKTFVAVMTTKKLLDVLGPKGAIGGLLAQMAGFGGGGPKGMLGGLGSAVGGLVSQVGAIVAGFAAALPLLLAIAAAVYVVHRGYKYITESVDGTFERIKFSFDLLGARFSNLTESLSSIWEKIAGLFGVDGTFSQFIGRLAMLSFEGIITGIDFFLRILRTVSSMTLELGDQLQWLWTNCIVDPVQRALTWVGKAFEGWGKVMKAVIYSLPGIGTAAQLLDAGKKVEVKTDQGWGALGPAKEMFVKHWMKTDAEDRRVALSMRAQRWGAEAADKINAATGPEAKDKRPPNTEMNFPNARFDITQNFAEGFDPDRIAVAFADDIAAMGEHKTMSGFTHPFAVGG